MSTQESKHSSTLFNVVQPLQHVRLLEVPDELLDIIVNSQESLYLKSAPSVSRAQSETNGKEGNLHLCTDNKSWAVKQVSTSNSIYITKTNSSVQINNDGEDGNEAINGEMEIDSPTEDKQPGLGISAIAKPTSILELHALPPATYETIVHDHLSGLVPTISSAEDVTVSGIENAYSEADLYSHIPAPTSVIQRILIQKCIFEIFWSKHQLSDVAIPKGQVYIPSPRLILSVWTEMVDNAVLAGKDMTDVEYTNTLHYQNGGPEVLDDADTPGDRHIKAIHRAISKRLLEQNGYLTTLGVINPETRKLNDRECTRWVGNLILAATQETQPTTEPPKDDFETKWENSVPADWIKYCTVEVLAPSCEVTTTTDGTQTVKWMPFTLEKDGAKKNSGSTAENENVPGGAIVAAAKNKRKWHEKFAAQRNAKK